MTAYFAHFSSLKIMLEKLQSLQQLFQQFSSGRQDQSATPVDTGTISTGNRLSGTINRNHLVINSYRFKIHSYYPTADQSWQYQDGEIASGLLFVYDSKAQQSLGIAGFVYPATLKKIEVETTEVETKVVVDTIDISTVYQSWQKLATAAVGSENTHGHPVSLADIQASLNVSRKQLQSTLDRLELSHPKYELISSRESKHNIYKNGKSRCYAIAFYNYNDKVSLVDNDSKDLPDKKDVLTIVNKGSGFVATLGSYKLESYGRRNTTLWHKDPDGILRTRFNWQIIQQIVETAVLEHGLNISKAYRTYAHTVEQAVKSGVDSASTMLWWKTLSQLSNEVAACLG